MSKLSGSLRYCALSIVVNVSNSVYSNLLRQSRTHRVLSPFMQVHFCGHTTNTLVHRRKMAHVSNQAAANEFDAVCIVLGMSIFLHDALVWCLHSCLYRFEDNCENGVRRWCYKWHSDSCQLHFYPKNISSSIHNMMYININCKWKAFFSFIPFLSLSL